MRQITFILKPTHKCNAECIYCSAFKENDNKPDMELDTYRKLLEGIVQYSRQSFLKHVRFTWHGGEPLMLKDDFYFRAFELQEKILGRTRIEYENLLQSNLLSVSRRRLKLLKHFGNIGSSFEFIPNIRVMKNGSYNDRWLKSLEILRENDLDVGIIYVVHRATTRDVERVYRFFCDFYTRYDVNSKFNGMYEEGKAQCYPVHQYSISGKDWGEFMVTFYRLWEADGKKIHFDPFFRYDDFHFNGVFMLDCDKTGRCFETHLGVDSDGTVYICGRGADNRIHPYGNIHKQTLGEIVASPKRIMLHNRVIYLKITECRDCGWWEYCHGGCPHEGIDSEGALINRSKWCTGLKNFFKTIYGKPNVHSQQNLECAS